jgi:hypothetical protein
MRLGTEWFPLHCEYRAKQEEMLWNNILEPPRRDQWSRSILG